MEKKSYFVAWGVDREGQWERKSLTRIGAKRVLNAHRRGGCGKWCKVYVMAGGTMLTAPHLRRVWGIEDGEPHTIPGWMGFGANTKGRLKVLANGQFLYTW